MWACLGPVFPCQRGVRGLLPAPECSQDIHDLHSSWPGSASSPCAHGAHQYQNKDLAGKTLWLCIDDLQSDNECTN